MRSRFLALLRARVLSITELEMHGAKSCGLLCAGGSENRGCACSGPKDCLMRSHPFYEKYVEYRSGQMAEKWKE